MRRFLIFMLLIPCMAAAKENFLTEKPEGVIFVEENGRKSGIGKEWWTPAPEDIRRFEKGLPGYLKSGQGAELVGKLARYKRQYFGIKTKEDRWILVNFFCSNWGDRDWRKDRIIVDDGGDCYFQLEFNPKIGIYRNLMINGDA